MPDRDSVTGLDARAAFDQQFPDFVREHVEARRPLSLVLVDIDKFKRINDSHGHPRGDSVLAEVAGRLASVVDEKGRAYRFGGEEFALVLPNHWSMEALSVAERARITVEAQPSADLQVTASFGVATLPDHATGEHELIDKADKALYDAKNLGRNLVRLFGEPPPQPGAREPQRKLPDPGALTEHERAHIRLQHFQGYEVHCPKDGALLEVGEDQLVSERTPRLRVRCKFCGLMDSF